MGGAISDEYLDNFITRRAPHGTLVRDESLLKILKYRLATTAQPK
jgi:hypothetical protein